MVVLGLTGSIGMGKSTTAQMFSDLGCPVDDADATVHRLYAHGGGAAAIVGARFPGVVVDGAVDRARLRAAVLGKPDEIAALEALVHPLVADARDAFLAQAAAAGARVAVVDIPLLFETNGAAQVDAVVVVTAPAAVQRARVLSRPGMTEEIFKAILARQIPDAEKRRRADYVIDTGGGLDAARAQVAACVAWAKDLDGGARRRAE